MPRIADVMREDQSERPSSVGLQLGNDRLVRSQPGQQSACVRSDVLRQRRLVGFRVEPIEQSFEFVRQIRQELRGG
jgi:hypothetical protein